MILLDYSMPEMDGLEVVTKMKEMIANNTELDDTDMPYVCCCTAYDGDDFKKLAMEAGMKNFLTKPISFDEILEVLRDCGLPYVDTESSEE